jgi:outer membrane protein
MRTFMVMSLAAVAVLLGAATIPQVQHKVAYLNASRILQDAPGAADARTAVQQEEQALQQKVKLLEDSITKMVQQYDARRQTMTADARRREEERLSAVETEMQATAQRLNLESNQRKQEIMQPVLNRVDDVIEAIRKEHGYAIIFDVTSRAIASADTTLDLTQQVLTRLRGSSGTGGGR